MRQAAAPSTGKPSGLARVCRVWGVTRARVYWHRHTPTAPGTRRGPVGPGTDDALIDHIRRLLAAAPFPGAGDRQGWARRRYQGRRTSPRRVLRLLRAHGWLAPTRHGPPPGPKAHDGTIITARVETRWGTDMTTTCPRQDGHGALFLAVEHGPAAWVGLHAALHGTRFEALAPSRPGVRTPCGACGQDIAQGLRRRHEHGSP